MVHYLKHPFDGCIERVRRAEEHLDELEREIGCVLQKQANAVPFDLDPKPPHGAINVRLPSETFAGIRLGTLVGEICYNLRAALDYLVYFLAELDSGILQKGTQFPIMNTAQDFAGNSKSMLVGLNATHIACIERLQPYNGCDWALRLRDISNMDKHRHVVPGGGTVRITVHSGLEKDLGRIIGFKRKAPHPLIGAEVDVKVHIAGYIAFTDATPTPVCIRGLPVIDTLKEINAGVADALAHFKLDF